MISKNADLTWFIQQLQDRIGLTPSEAGRLVRNTMIAGQLTGLAPTAMCLPKMSVRSHITKDNGIKNDFVIPSELWNFFDADWEPGNLCYNFQTNESSWVIHEIFVDRASAMYFLDLLHKSAQSNNNLHTESPKKSLKNKSKGGRPPKYDWQKCQVEAERWMTQNGRPSTFAELYKYMAIWFGNNEPAESTLKARLRPIYRDFK